jgi:hypothetical protein
MGRMHTQRTEELMREAEQPPELMAAKLASQLHIDYGKALLALLRELARAHLISMPPGADARLESHRIEEALITGECC